MRWWQPPPVTQQLPTWRAPARVPFVPIVHQAERFCVVSKPPGIMVHRNSFSKRGETALLRLVRDQLGRHVNPVHRLDGGTSGRLLFAYDSETCAMLQAAMQREDAHKVYLAFCRGDAGWIQGHTVDRSIKDDSGVQREARTRLDCLASCSDDLPERSSLVRCVPSTGRWHQIRKHLNGLAHPILGDAKHGDSRVNRWWQQEREMRHLGLHCHEMRLTLADGDVLDVRCPVRPDLVSVWRELPWWEQACEALPTLVDDAADARVAMLAERAAEDHTERVAASGRGMSVLHRK